MIISTIIQMPHILELVEDTRLECGNGKKKDEIEILMKDFITDYRSRREISEILSERLH